MKTLLTGFLLFICGTVLAQTIEGNRLLDLLNKPVSDPLFKQLKLQENFYTDAWDQQFTIYISRNSSDVITEVELENKKKRYGSEERYGRYNRKLPLELNWDMKAADFEAKLGRPTLVSTNMNFSDYSSGGLKLRIFYENSVPVSISFSKPSGTPVTATPVTPTVTPKPQPQPGNIKTGALLSIVNGRATLNWDIMESMINNFHSMQSFAGKDSTDYIGQVYYSSLATMPGFQRAAVKRVKRDGRWYFEAFLKVEADSNKARDIFFQVYDELKAKFKDRGGDDFILASVAKKSLSESPVNWMAQWSLYSRYKNFAPGLNKVKVMWFLSGMSNAFKDNRMDYTFKFYLIDDRTEVDFFTWDTPR